MLEEKILNYNFYKKNKILIRNEYRKKDLTTRYKIKRVLYKSSYSIIKKNEIWDFLNQSKEEKI